MSAELSTDVLIIGAGPAGSTFARKLVSENRKVVMVDIGAQQSSVPGQNLKNTFPFQRNMGLFSNVIRGQLHSLSVPVSAGVPGFLDPITYKPETGFVRAGMNPNQKPDRNLDSAAAAYAVGGMLLHWTGAIPRQHPGEERIPFISDSEWDALYTEAEALLNLHTDVYQDSVRNKAVKEWLTEYYTGRLPSDYPVQDLPMAAERDKKNPDFVRYTGTDTIFGDIAHSAPSNFLLLEQHRVTRLEIDGERVVAAVVDDLRTRQTFKIVANTYVIACGTVLSAQLLWASGITEERLPALGRYIYDHPIAFCQVVMRKELIDRMRELTEGQAKEGLRRQSFSPKDPLPIPMNDPEPNVWIPVSDERPWHCQITKDAFHYGDLPANVDDRIVVDLRWFAKVDVREENRVTFEKEIFNEMGMPQPTFEFAFSDNDALRLHEMMEDMVGAAQSLGGFLPGSEPKFMPWGLCLHLQGACRMGESDRDSVVDPYGKVWGVENLYVGGNSVIPTSNACNPTLTTVALAIRSSLRIAQSI